MEVLEKTPSSQPSRQRVVVCCFSEQEIERFWDGAQQASVAGFGMHWVSPPVSAGDWLSLLKSLRPEVILGAWQLPRIPDEFLEEYREFRYLCYFCGSVRERISRRFLERGGIVTNWGELAARTVAECALMLILASLRRVTRYALEMHVDRVWDRSEPMPASLFGKSVGIHGFGTVARQLHSLLSPFGCRVEYWSAGVPDTVYAEHGAQTADSLEALFANNDVVVEVEALNSQTRHSVTAGILNLLKSGSVFVNVGRGNVLAPHAIEILAARGDVLIGLDVYDSEPLRADSPLRGAHHVMLLPHTAGPTTDQYAAIRKQALGYLEQYLSGQSVPNLSLEAYDRMT